MSPPSTYGAPNATEGAWGTVIAIERLRAGRATIVRTEGESMEPFLQEGERVMLEPCTARCLRAGDVFAFERADRLVLHRVIAVHRATGLVIEQGDNARAPTRIREAAVLARAAWIVGPPRADLRRGRLRAIGPWIARVVAWRGVLHRRLERLARRYPSTRLPALLEAVDRIVRAIVGAARRSARPAAARSLLRIDGRSELLA